MKILTLHVHSELAEDGRHISTMGLDMAHGFGAFHHRNQMVQHIFTSPLVATIETAAVMVVENPAFSQSCRHPVIDGLGSDAALMHLHNEKFEDLIAGGVSVMEAFTASHDCDAQHVFEVEAMGAIHQMFSCMEDGEMGVGVFHSSFIILAAYLCGLRDVHTLDILEAVVFEFRGEHNIIAKRKLIS